MQPDRAAFPFRLAGPADVDGVVRLTQSAYRGEASRAGWTTEADLLDGVRTDAPAVAALISPPSSVVLVADRPAPAVGLLACCNLRDEGGGAAYLGLLAVDPAAQGGGVGRAVVAEAERRVRAAWGAATLRMTVIRQRDDLIAWYERLGFSRTGETEPFPYGQVRFGVPKRPDLEFAVLAKALA